MGIGPSALDREYVLDKIFKDRSHVSHKVFSICLAEPGAQCNGSDLCFTSAQKMAAAFRWGGQFNVGGFDDSSPSGQPPRALDKNHVKTEVPHRSHGPHSTEPWWLLWRKLDQNAGEMHSKFHHTNQKRQYYQNDPIAKYCKNNAFQIVENNEPFRSPTKMIKTVWRWVVPASAVGEAP